MNNERFFFITFLSKGISWTKKLSVYEGMAVYNAFLAKYGQRAGDHELKAINGGNYTLQEVSSPEWKAEKRYSW